MKVLLVGDYPPPYGGVSVQISILAQLLSSTPGVSCDVLDIGESRRRKRPQCVGVSNGVDFAVKTLSYSARGHLIHLHTNGHNLKSWVIVLVSAMAGMMNRGRTVVSIGSGLAPAFMAEAGRLTRILVRLALTASGAIICRNAKAKDAMIDLGVPGAKIHVISGFYGLGVEQPGPIPPEIETFMRDHSPVVGAMASIGPEYGIPLVVESVRRLRSVHPRIGALLIGPGGVETHDLDGDLLATGELLHTTALSLMRRLDVFVRPTYFDGDALSVREALGFGVPVVASDTDFRPPGVILFQRGSADDLSQKLLESLAYGHKSGRLASGGDSLREVLAVYRTL